MFVICDRNDVVQDIATEEENLSRGKLFSDYKLYENVTETDMIIGDDFKDGVLIKNDQLRHETFEKAETERKIASKTRAISIAELIKAGELPADFEDEQ